MDAAVRHQTIEGFGTCLISWMPRMDQFYKTPPAATTYAEDLRFNFLRCNLWGDGTIPLTEGPARISHKDPAFAAQDRRTPVFIAFAKAIQQINPKVKVIGTVWSPPAWMKENHSITDKFSGAATGETYRSNISGGQSQHALMSTSGKTKKTQVVRQFSRFIAPGSIRVEASPAFGAVMASAYVTADGDKIAVVLINPNAQEQPVSLALRGGPKVTELQATRTSATEDCQTVEAVTVRDGKAAFIMPGQCIVTLPSAR